MVLRKLKKGEILLLVISEKSHLEIMVKLTEKICKTFEKVCYVTLNKPYTTLIKFFKKRGIDVSRIFFIDTVSAQGVENDQEPVVCVSSPRALTELNIAIKNVVEVGKIECVIFDSLSTLLIYEKPHVVMKFIHSIISDFRSRSTACVLTVIRSDLSENVIKDIALFVDGISKVK